MNIQDLLGLFIVVTPTTISTFVGWSPAQGVEIFWHYSSNLRVSAPDGGMTGNFVLAEHYREANWSKCPCGERLVGYFKRTIADIHIEDPENQTWPTASGVSIAVHELSHAYNEILYDELDDLAYSAVYDKCISKKCRTSWEKWRYDMIELGSTKVDIANLELEVRDYPDDYNRQVYQGMLNQARSKLLNILQKIVVSGRGMVLDCAL